MWERLLGLKNDKITTKRKLFRVPEIKSDRMTKINISIRKER